MSVVYTELIGSCPISPSACKCSQGKNQILLTYFLDKFFELSVYDVSYQLSIYCGDDLVVYISNAEIQHV